MTLDLKKNTFDYKNAYKVIFELGKSEGIEQLFS